MRLLACDESCLPKPFELAEDRAPGELPVPLNPRELPAVNKPLESSCILFSPGSMVAHHYPAPHSLRTAWWCFPALALLSFTPGNQLKPRPIKGQGRLARAPFRLTSSRAKAVWSLPSIWFHPNAR